MSHKLDELYGIIIALSPDLPEGRRRFINVLRAIWSEEPPTG